SPRSDDHEHLELPGMLEDPYVEVALQAPPSLDYIPGLEEPEPAPPLPDYAPESDLEAYLEEDDDEDPEEDPVDYPADGGDDGDDEEGISIPTPVPVPAWSDSEFARLLAMSTPSSSPLSPLSSPPPQISFPPLPPILSPPSPVLSPAPPPSPIRSLGYRGGHARGYLPPRKRLGITLGPRYEVGESSSSTAARSAGGLRADYGFVAAMDREIRRDPEREVGYEITDSWDEISERQLLAGRLNMLFRDRRAHVYTRYLMETEARLSREAWVRSMDASDLARGEVMSLCTTVLGQMTNIRELYAADRRRQIVTSEMLRANHRRFAEIRGLRTANCTQQQQLIQTLTVMQSLQRQVNPLQEQVTTLQGQVTALQGQMIALQGQVTALQGQQGPAGGLTQPELPEEAGSST
nr:hypothetical protein [Tanacetum cinerariifolium]